MMMNKRLISLLCGFCILLGTFGVPSLAATGYQGYAAYHDGVFFGFEWHSAIMDKPGLYDVKPLIHAPGNAINVQFDSWAAFMDGNIFQGFYRPSSKSITSTQRDAITAMARQLASNQIDYTVLCQMHYDELAQPSGIYFVRPQDIIAMRCDGVVEYCYERNNFRIYGDTARWDISAWPSGNKIHHGGLSITPKKQCENYMTLVSAHP